MLAFAMTAHCRFLATSHQQQLQGAIQPPFKRFADLTNLRLQTAGT